MRRYRVVPVETCAYLSPSRSDPLPRTPHPPSFGSGRSVRPETPSVARYSSICTVRCASDEYCKTAFPIYQSPCSYNSYNTTVIARCAPPPSPNGRTMMFSDVSLQSAIPFVVTGLVYLIVGAIYRLWNIQPQSTQALSNATYESVSSPKPAFSVFNPPIQERVNKILERIKGFKSSDEPLTIPLAFTAFASGVYFLWSFVLEKDR
jgi:hypothetical protein